MAGRGTSPEFVEALARGLDVLTCFDRSHPTMSLAEVAGATGLARPTARRLLLTLRELGYVRAERGAFALTPKVLQLGMAYVSSLGLWEIARPHMAALVEQTRESTSMSQLDGSDIVYMARVAVPKIIALRVEIGTRFPATRTSQGKVLLAAMSEDELAATLATPSRANLDDVLHRQPGDLGRELLEVRSRGWALADEELARGVRSVAVPVQDGSGRVCAAMNVTVHAAETSVETLVERYLPLLVRAAGQVSAEWALWQSRPHVEILSAVPDARAAAAGVASASMVRGKPGRSAPARRGRTSVHRSRS